MGKGKAIIMNTAWKFFEGRNGIGLLLIFTIVAVCLKAGQWSASGAERQTMMDGYAHRVKEMTLVLDLHERIVANTRETAEATMKQYQVDLPSEEPRPSYPRKPFTMLPIKGGSFSMGNSDLKSDVGERPAHMVTVDPFWMQQCEVTWNEYEPYMLQDYRRSPNWKSNSVADAVAYPSKPYLEMSFGMGKDGYPAISMSQHAANKYCQWLSARTGHFYRLPTEAEWEYACRAGTQTAYSFGDNPADLPKYAWFEDNCNFKYQKVGRLLPNPWGLHDMHGNVAEWTLDGFAAYDKASAMNPWIKATNTYPHVVRGGSWAQTAAACRSASRRPSDGSWNGDNTLPRSSWHLTHSTVGFRVVRPLKVPTAHEMFAYWNNEVEIDFGMAPSPKDLPTE